MLQISGHKFYFAEKDAKPVGVFASPEAAQCADYDFLTEITPFLLDGSPASDRYVCMAKGSCVMLLRKEEGFETAYFDLGPAWGLNPQSAVGGLYGVHNSRKGVTVTELYLFEIDRVYAKGELENFRDQSPFSALTHRTDTDSSFTQEQLETDYITLWIDREQAAALYAQRASSAEVELLADRLTEAACAGTSRRCGFSFSRVYRRTHDQIKHQLLHSFTQPELKLLAVLLLLMEPSEEVPFLQGEEAAELLERVKECFPAPALRRLKTKKPLD